MLATRLICCNALSERSRPSRRDPFSFMIGKEQDMSRGLRQGARGLKAAGYPHSTNDSKQLRASA